MSVRHIGLVLDHLEASPAVKLVALILADHADSDGVCWPSYRRIAERSCMSQVTVKRHVRALRTSGIVTKIRTGTISTIHGRTLRITNAYRINADVLASRQSLLSTGDLCKGVAADPLQGVAADPYRGSLLTPKPSLEPSSLTVSSVEPVDNSLCADGALALPGLERQSGSPRRVGDVLATMGVSTDRADEV